MRALKRNKSAFYVNVQGIFFNICVLSQCTVYQRNFQNIWTKYSKVDSVIILKAVFHKIYLVHSWILCLIYTFTYQKVLLHTLLFLVFKTVESLQKLKITCWFYYMKTLRFFEAVANTCSRNVTIYVWIFSGKWYLILLLLLGQFISS